jgi:tetratricopeptide (TPR) repeat protein
MKLGRPEQALTALREAEDLFGQLGDFEGVAATLDVRVGFLTELGRFEEAVIQAERQLVAERGQMPVDGPVPAGTNEEREPLKELASLERLRRSLEDLQAKGSRPTLLRVFDTKTRIFLKLGRPDEALDCLNQIERICRESGMTVVRSLLQTKARLLVFVGRSVEALSPLVQAEKLCKESGDLAGIAEILGDRLKILSKLGRIEEAVIQAGRKVAAESGQMPSDGGLPQDYWTTTGQL